MFHAVVSLFTRVQSLRLASAASRSDITALMLDKSFPLTTSVDNSGKLMLLLLSVTYHLSQAIFILRAYCEVISKIEIASNTGIACESG